MFRPESTSLTMYKSFSRIYMRAGRQTSFGDFINCLYLGHGYELYGLLQDKMPFIILGFAFVNIGIAVLIFSIVAKCYKMSGMDRGAGLACVTILGGIWILFDGGYPYLTLLFKNPLLFNTLDIMMVYIIPSVFLFYTYTFLENKITKKTGWPSWRYIIAAFTNCHSHTDIWDIRPI